MKLFKAIGVAAALAMAGAGAHAAVVVTKDTSSPVSIPGLTGFATTGADMAGMTVTARFSGPGGDADPIVETLTWAATGAVSGGVASNRGWGLSVNGDTFDVAWNFTIDGRAGLGQLTSFTLNGGAPNAFTVFDTSEPSPGTEGSANGRDFSFAANCDQCDATAHYSAVVAIDPFDPEEDIFHMLTVSFTELSAPSVDFSFFQDTDNDSRRANPVPEPGTLMLAGLALAGLGVARRRVR